MKGKYLIKIFSLIVSKLSFIIYSANLFEIQNKVKFVYDQIECTGRINFKLDSRIRNGLIQIEDKRYYYHYGVDIKAIIRSIYNIVFKRKLQGASTIEQQLVRTITKKYKISIRRKSIELMISSLLRYKYSKEEIIKIYLLLANFGDKIIGINELCISESFNLRKLSDEECSYIIAKIKYPNVKKSSNLFDKFLVRRNLILNIITTQDKANTKSTWYSENIKIGAICR